MSTPQEIQEARETVQGCLLVTLFFLAVFSVVVLVLALGIRMAFR